MIYFLLGKTQPFTIEILHNELLRRTNLHAPTIWFKEKGSTDFIKLDSKDVYKVLFLSDDVKISLTETFKVRVRKLKVKKFQPFDKDKEEIYYLSKLKDGPY